jgi:hypothetical protein
LSLLLVPEVDDAPGGYARSYADFGELIDAGGYRHRRRGATLIEFDFPPPAASRLTGEARDQVVVEMLRTLQPALQVLAGEGASTELSFDAAVR